MNFCVFSLVTKMWKVGQKAIQINAILKLDFQKWKQLYIFPKKIIQTTLKRHIFACGAITFSLKQRQTRASSGTITLPLTEPVKFKSTL